MKDRTVLQAKRLGIVSCQRQDALGGIAQRMADDDISALVVVNPADDLAGIISRSDLLRAYMEDQEGWRALPKQSQAFVHGPGRLDGESAGFHRSRKPLQKRAIVVDDQQRIVFQRPAEFL